VISEKTFSGLPQLQNSGPNSGPKLAGPSLPQPLSEISNSPDQNKIESRMQRPEVVTVASTSTAKTESQEVEEFGPSEPCESELGCRTILVAIGTGVACFLAVAGLALAIQQQKSSNPFSYW